MGRPSALEIRCCRTCGEEKPLTEYFSKGNGKRHVSCKTCEIRRRRDRRRERKQRAIDYLGGKCAVCGYDRCSGAMDFHHISPSEKDPKVKRITRWSWEKVVVELDKCVLLCANCHREVHYMTDHESDTE